MQEDSKRRFINNEGIEMVHESFLNDNGEEIGFAEYPYYTPEEEARMQAEMQAQQEAMEHERQLEIQKEKMNGTILAQILLNQAQLTAALKEKGAV